MAFFSTIIIRRAAASSSSSSSLTPLVIHATNSQRNYGSALFTPLLLLKKKKTTTTTTTTLSQGELYRRTSLLPILHLSSLAKKPTSEQSLLAVIESEIKCAEESDDHDQVEETPNEFPFEIQDNPGQQTVSLRREYEGETITVEVHMPDLSTGDEEEESEDDASSETSSQSYIPLVVSVSKGSGPCLEFGCTAYPDEISIDSLSVKEPDASEDLIAYEGPDFSDLDENLQKGFHKYLEIRGIKPSTTNFLHEYMVNKDSREYLMWLKNLKKFIER